jgi:DNA invertase Pin-like site-specific DNA recombinase
MAEFERSLIRERTRAGRKAAMTRGVKFGRPPKLSAEQIALIARLADEGQTAPQIAETFGVHESMGTQISTSWTKHEHLTVAHRFGMNVCDP